jgi:predicted RecA/RadA family phage recombinase
MALKDFTPAGIANAYVETIMKPVFLTGQLLDADEMAMAQSAVGKIGLPAIAADTFSEPAKNLKNLSKNPFFRDGLKEVVNTAVEAAAGRDQKLQRKEIKNLPAHLKADVTYLFNNAKLGKAKGNAKVAVSIAQTLKTGGVAPMRTKGDAKWEPVFMIPKKEANLAEEGAVKEMLSLKTHAISNSTDVAAFISTQKDREAQDTENPTSLTKRQKAWFDVERAFKKLKSPRVIRVYEGAEAPGTIMRTYIVGGTKNGELVGIVLEERNRKTATPL